MFNHSYKFRYFLYFPFNQQQHNTKVQSNFFSAQTT